uniref:ARAD1A19030p n=1 Tax=Blastobotrys adeninivorans TaxID=409370 RepID=A0A060SY94_BLAAD
MSEKKTEDQFLEDVDLDKQAAYAKEAGVDRAEILVPAGMTLDDIGATEKEIKKLTWKIDFAIIPFLAVCYVFYYVDKTTLSYAAIFGIKEDLNLKGDEYSWLSSVFYFGFLVWQMPANFLLVKFPVGKYLGVNIFLWGAFLMIQAACPNFASLAVVRILGGAAEAVSDASFMLITSIWYTRRQQPVRIGTWYSANGLGIAVGGLLGYGIGHIKGALPSWKYEFLIIGALCAAWGIVVFIFLPDSPIDAKFLTEREKTILLIRLRENQTGVESKVLKWKQVLEAATDPKCLMFFLIAFFGNIPNGGISNFGTLIIQGFGFSTLGTTLLQVPYGAIVVIALLAAVHINDHVGENKRTIMACLFMLPNITGAFGLYFLPESNKAGRLICYYLTGPYNAAFVIFLSMVTGNIAGHSKKVTANGMLFLGVCVGNIAGPFFYKSSQAPKYPLGIGSMLFSHFCEILCLILLGIWLKYQNVKRDRAGNSDDHDLSNAFLDMTDKENPNFRYIY